MKINDDYIIGLFFTKNGKGPINSLIRRNLESNKVIISPEVDCEIKKYLSKRYSDSKSLRETLFRIKYHIEVRPHCTTLGCTNEVAFNGTKKKPYMLHCCCTCTLKDAAVRNKQADTCMKLYGCINGAQSEVVKKKILKTLEQKYGKGITNVWQAKEIQEKAKQTLIKKYGVDNIAKSKDCQAKHYAHMVEIVEKRNITKKKNHTFNTSNVEEQCYEMLVLKFGVDNVKRQYSSELYPFACDFYLVNEDIYIEFNGSWTHGKHAFDCNNKDDIAVVDKWKNKHTKYYDIAINTWTIRDVNKRNIAKLNMILYKEFWKINDFNRFLEEFRK